jgi:hypothetical protein
MSADNGIYILHTADGQNRVAEIFAADNLNWSFLNFKSDNPLVSTRLIEYFGNCKVFNDADVLKHAKQMYDECSYCEYGIVPIESKKTWKQIIEESKSLAKQEIEAINQHGDGRWDSYLEKLKSIETA